MATALITGASAGIGKTFAQQLAAKGHDLVVVARDEARLADLKSRLESEHGISVEVLPADLTERLDVQDVAARLADPAKPVDMLVNNAGYGLKKGFLDNDIVDEEHMLTILVRTPVVLSHAAAKAMRERGHGAIINVSSMAGFLATGTYAAAKSYLTTFSESLAAELDGTGVTVTALCPGFTRTEFHQRAGITRQQLPDALWLDADKLVSQCLRDVDRGKVISVPGVHYKAAAGLLDVLPRGVARNSAFKSRHRPQAR
ncbi:SDR family NAD(P)-dependent oxidoreductase [Luteipulveratus mongoliensis]|uniref:Short-chain dehydrogenase n=1 Tax=Luteipulveratus mongoliensis TaxID=571913 RepID=A0A0K1JFZ7_9MICO|nr:SDR family oxidoreductase [Luteipulveratus mongoliensis]AKU15520.1 short-chain dehydrogenase [Luteipulveratus mongoliensis]